MAWNVGIKKKTVFGDMRVVILSCTADAPTQAVVTGLKNIYGFSTAYASCASGGPKVYINSSASGVPAAGTLGCSGFTSGDVVFFTVYGV